MYIYNHKKRPRPQAPSSYSNVPDSRPRPHKSLGDDYELPFISRFMLGARVGAKNDLQGVVQVAAGEYGNN